MASINRRRFLKAAGAAGAGAAAPAVAAPAIAQTSPEIQWRMPVSWPKALDTLYGGAEQFCKYVSEATDGKFQIRPMLGDERIPALEVTEAVANGTVEACHTAPYYMFAKDPTFAFGCAVPFGLNGRMQNAWWLEGGGEGLMNAFYAKYNIYGLLAGNTMAQMGGWFRKEINTIDDLKGVKMRIAGFAAAVISKLGVVTQQLPGSDIYQALEKGTVDAAEWVGPHDDEKLGLHKVAKFYYYPGWWEGGAMIHVQVNKEKWEALPKSYQAILKAVRGAGPQLHGRPLRCAQSDSAEKDPGDGHTAATVLGGDPGRLLQVRQRGLCRDQRQERGFQEALGVDQGIPRRPVPVAAAGRQHLRQLHADPAAQEDAVTSRLATGAPIAIGHSTHGRET